MRIAHIVTLVNKDGAFGGPLSVATAQVTELARRGHQVTLLGGWDGVATVDLPSLVDVRLSRAYQVVPRAGFSGLVSPRLLRDLHPSLRRFDVVHVHLGRDFISSTAALLTLRRRIPYVLQTHGMVIPDARPKARVVDYLAMRRLLLGAASVFALNEAELLSLEGVSPGTSLRRLPNGIGLRPEAEARARHEPDTPDVLFCARLHPRKRVLAFVEMAALLISRGSDARFSIVGPDEGDLRRLIERTRVLGMDKRVTYEGALSPVDVPARLSGADVFVLPSVDEPFPMTVLEALAAGTPTVLTDSCRIAADLQGRGAALMTDGSAVEMADAVERLLGDPAERARLRSNGLAAIRDAYGIRPVVDQLEIAYEDAVAQTGRPRG